MLEVYERHPGGNWKCNSRSTVGGFGLDVDPWEAFAWR